MIHFAFLLSLTAGALANVPRGADDSFVNWESPHVSPLDLTPDGKRLLAVNTADNRLEVFSVRASGLVHRGAIPVGLDPVSVRAFSDSIAWIVNSISDRVSVVDIDAGNVIATLTTLDQPADVVFANGGSRAFVTCSRANAVMSQVRINPWSRSVVETSSNRLPCSERSATWSVIEFGT